LVAVPLSWIRAYPYTLAAVLLLIGLAVPFLLRHESEWDDVYVRAANHLRAGENIYNAHEGFVYPPALAALALPCTYLPQDLERLAWYLVTAAGLVMLVRCSWQLAGGGPLEGRPLAPRVEHLIWLLGLGCGFRYALDCFTHQQTDLLIGGLVLAGCFALFRSRAVLAATCFGIAAGFKATPLLWCGYLLWRRQWRAAGWVVAVAVGVNLVPNLVHAPPQGGLWGAYWVKHYLVPLTRAEFYPGIWYSETLYNQALCGAANRWLTTEWTWNDDGFTVADREHPIRPGLFKGLLYGLELALVVGALAVLGRRAPEAESRRPARPPRLALEYSVVMLLMLLLSPMSSKPHFCTLLLPGFCLARLAIAGRHRGLGVLVAAAILAGAVGVRGLAGSDPSSLALWCGNVTWSTLILLVGCGYALLQQRSAGAINSVPLPRNQAA
jgi:hypothetical protein